MSFPEKRWEVLLWTMGESLMGPNQILHALKICQDALQSHAASELRNTRNLNGDYNGAVKIFDVYVYMSRAQICIHYITYTDSYNAPPATRKMLSVLAKTLLWEKLVSSTLRLCCILTSSQLPCRAKFGTNIRVREHLFKKIPSIVSDTQRHVVFHEETGK